MTGPVTDVLRDSTRIQSQKRAVTIRIPYLQVFGKKKALPTVVRLVAESTGTDMLGKASSLYERT